MSARGNETEDLLSWTLQDEEEASSDASKFEASPEQADGEGQSSDEQGHSDGQVSEYEEDGGSDVLDVDVLESGDTGYMTPPSRTPTVAKEAQTSTKEERADHRTHKVATTGVDPFSTSAAGVHDKELLAEQEGSDGWSDLSDNGYCNESEQHG